MLQRQKSNKRGRPKRNNYEDDDSSQDFSKKKAKKKTLKSTNNSKSKKQIMDLKRKKTGNKNKIQMSSSSSLSGDSGSSEQIEIKIINVPLQMFTPDKIFAQILNKANKQHQFLLMLRNLLSGCSRTLKDKKIYISKKWHILRNSNCTQQQYLNRQAQLKKFQFQQIHEAEKDIMSKLSYANVKGFESKQNIIHHFRQKLDQKIDQNAQFQINQAEWQKYHDNQKKLLHLLMNQIDLVSSTSTTVAPVKNITHQIKDKPILLQQNEMDQKINNIQTQQSHQTTQFLFCKHFSQINYEKVIDHNSSNPFKLCQNDIYYMDPKALNWILQTKSDQIYINQKFQRQTYKKYTQMLQNIYSNYKSMSDEALIQQLLQIAAYILNSVHYYQKFKLKCDLLHPLDLLFLVQKIRKQKKNTEEHTQMHDQTFQKQIAMIAQSLVEVNQRMIDQ